MGPCSLVPSRKFWGILGRGLKQAELLGGKITNRLGWGDGIERVLVCSEPARPPTTALLGPSVAQHGVLLTVLTAGPGLS